MHCLACLCVLLLPAAAYSQVIYQPVTFQHNTPNTYYYGGTNPIQHTLASLPHFRSPLIYRGDIRTFAQFPSPVYSDAWPYANLRPLGFTPSDASNEAHRNVPTYFRKSDLLKTAEPQSDGTFHVPAIPLASGISSHPAPIASPRNPLELQKGVILIIPSKPKPSVSQKTVQASAR